MSVTAKIKCTGKTELHGTESGDQRQVQLSFQPDYDDGRNKEWALYTPSLSLTMTVKGEVADRFEPGSCFTLTFEEDVSEPDGNEPPD